MYRRQLERILHLALSARSPMLSDKFRLKCQAVLFQHLKFGWVRGFSIPVNRHDRLYEWIASPSVSLASLHTTAVKHQLNTHLLTHPT